MDTEGHPATGRRVRAGEDDIGAARPRGVRVARSWVGGLGKLFLVAAVAAATVGEGEANGRLPRMMRTNSMPAIVMQSERRRYSDVYDALTSSRGMVDERVSISGGQPSAGESTPQEASPRSIRHRFSPLRRKNGFNVGIRRCASIRNGLQDGYQGDEMKRRSDDDYRPKRIADITQVQIGNYPDCIVG